MSAITKPKQIISVIVNGRKLKGQKVGRFSTWPLSICERLHIDPGDIIEVEIRKVTKKEIIDSQIEETVNASISGHE